jgi:hypothetical protein
VNLSRRTFIAAGVLGVAALAATRFLPRPSVTGDAGGLRALDADGAAVLAAVAPALLEGALPDEPASRREALRETLVGVDTAILGLPPAMQRELGQLFALLASLPGRVLLARTPRAWSDMSGADVEAFLLRLQASRWSLLRAAYDAIHQLVLAAWYGNPRSWSAIGYGGPPALEGG